jgi:hypothetical protein
MLRSKESRRCLLSIAAAVLSALCPAGVSAEDCNRNGVEDAVEIATEAAVDCNGNGLPDGCESVPLEFRLGDGTIALDQPPEASASADFNGDGVSDLATGNRGADRISELEIFLSTGRGEFESIGSYPAGVRISSVVAADFDGDRDYDIITVDSDRLFFFWNRGDGTFSSEQSIELPRFSRSIQAADFDGDGAIDVVVSNTREDSVFVFFNRVATDGTFTSPVQYAVQDQPQPLRVADLDLDGDVDLVVANERSLTLSILFNDGGGGFNAQRTVPTDEDLRCVEVSDIDGDGAFELVAGGSSSLKIWRGDGAGLFDAPESFSVSVGLIVGDDFDRDGDSDLVVVGHLLRSISVLANSGAGRFSVTEIAVDVVSLAANDFDDDGDLDLAVGAEAPPRVDFLWNGGGAVSLDSMSYLANGPPHEIVATDFSGDAFPDIVTANSDNASYTTFRGVGDGTFENGIAIRTSRSLPSVAHGDFDDDGDEDIAFGSTPLLISWNDGSGVFADSTDYPVSLNSNSRTVASSDVDGDGRPEVIGAQEDVVRVVFIVDADGSVRVEDYEVDAVAQVNLADFDGDGSQDIVVARALRSDVSVLFNRGDGTFGAPVSLPVSGNPGALAPADFDGDGSMDIAAVNVGTSDVVVFLNESSGKFALLMPFALSRPPTQRAGFIAFEVDGDGAVDLAISNTEEGSVTVLRGRGDGTFGSEFVFHSGPDARAPVSADFDLDGDFDLVLGNRQAMSITVFLNGANRAPIPELYLDRVCTELDFVHLSIPTAAADARRATKFVVPARDDAELLPTVFQNVQRSRLPQEFLQEAFPKRFPSLTSEEYSRLMTRRDTRQYYVGTITELRFDLDGSAGKAYGFSVELDASSGPEDSLTLEEVKSVHDRLRAVFQLEPFGYLPHTTAEVEAAEKWQDPGFPIRARDTSAINGDDFPGPPAAQPVFEYVVPPGLEMCGTFWEAGVDRGLRDELELKSVVRFRGGTLELPVRESVIELDLFDEVRFGPAGEVATPRAPGSFQVRVVPSADDVTAYRFTYNQSFVAEDGTPIDIEMVAPLVFRARGDEIFDVPSEFDESFFTKRVGGEAFWARVDGVTRVRYGSCGYPTIPLWEVDALLADGTRLVLEERYSPQASELDTGSASLVRADVSFAGDQQPVTSYWQLVYSADRHNRGVRYWVVLNEPVRLERLDSVVFAIELQTPAEEQPALARFLDERFDVLTEVAVNAFSRGPGDPALRFRRGDVNDDDHLDVSDALGLLSFLFADGDRSPCRSAGDANDDGRLNLTDAVVVVCHLFRNGGALPPPENSCDRDPTPDALGCESYGSCHP